MYVATPRFFFSGSVYKVKIEASLGRFCLPLEKTFFTPVILGDEHLNNMLKSDYRIRGEQVRIIDLGILERIMIIMRCRRDLREEQFKEFTYICKSMTEVKLFVSPYVTTELAFFIAQRRKILDRQYVSVNISDKKTPFGIRILRFHNAVCRIDRLIAGTELNIGSILNQYDDRIRGLQIQSERFLEHQALHQAQLCLNQMDTICSEKQSIIWELKKKLLAFAGKKVRIINNVNAKIDLYKTRRILRIQYYYNYACSHSTLPVMIYSQEDLEAICGEKIDIDHTGKLQTIQEKIVDIIRNNNKEVDVNEEVSS